MTSPIEGAAHPPGRIPPGVRPPRHRHPAIDHSRACDEEGIAFRAARLVLAFRGDLPRGEGAVA